MIIFIVSHNVIIHLTDICIYIISNNIIWNVILLIYDIVHIVVVPVSVHHIHIHICIVNTIKFIIQTTLHWHCKGIQIHSTDCSHCIHDIWYHTWMFYR